MDKAGVAVGLATISVVLAAVYFAAENALNGPMHFIERHFGFSPDGGDGSTEIMFAVVLVALVVLGATRLATKLSDAREPLRIDQEQRRSECYRCLPNSRRGLMIRAIGAFALPTRVSWRRKARTKRPKHYWRKLPRPMTLWLKMPKTGGDESKRIKHPGNGKTTNKVALM